LVAAAKLRDQEARAKLAGQSITIIEKPAANFAALIAREIFHPNRSGKRSPRPNPFGLEALTPIKNENAPAPSQIRKRAEAKRPFRDEQHTPPLRTSKSEPNQIGIEKTRSAMKPSG
jgi:hypothetical protein